MSVERWWRRPRPNPVEPAVTDPCPICVHLERWYGDGPVQAATHGAGGPDGSWQACFEHFKVISAFEWLGLTRHITRPESPPPVHAAVNPPNTETSPHSPPRGLEPTPQHNDKARG